MACEFFESRLKIVFRNLPNHLGNKVGREVDGKYASPKFQFDPFLSVVNRQEYRSSGFFITRVEVVLIKSLRQVADNLDATMHICCALNFDTRE